METEKRVSSVLQKDSIDVSSTPEIRTRTRTISKDISPISSQSNDNEVLGGKKKKRARKPRDVPDSERQLRHRNPSLHYDGM